MCKECSRLGRDELIFRQAVSDIDRLCDWDGIVRRKHRKAFERFLAHPSERVKQYAEEVAARRPGSLAQPDGDGIEGSDDFEEEPAG
ncbi:MAG: hypothetical protein FJZ01_13805 [Candidatus Sericytochromatia bacterium]|nr:hypothetical protein [Candidatus Tanganyikabacteria bacterium]